MVYFTRFKRTVLYSSAVLALCLVATFLQMPATQVGAQERSPIDLWLTTSDLSSALQKQPSLDFSGADPGAAVTINVDESQKYQRVDGFGAALTDSAAWLIYTKLNEQQRTAVLHQLFDPETGNGLSTLRLPMGASDISLPVPGEYSYDDLPDGQVDPQLTHFSIAHDEAYIIPVLKQALAINPRLKIIASPWSPPAWMKANNSMNGGPLKPEYFETYAQYFVKFLQAYKQQGIPIYAITPANEPLYAPATYPGLLLQPEQERDFIKNNLGPALQANHLSPKIYVYDHNWDRPDFPLSTYTDPQASAYVTGTGWHCYGGDITIQSYMHDLYPQKENHLTECSGGPWQVNDRAGVLGDTSWLAINDMRNWGNSLTLWTMAMDPNYQPNLGTSSACQVCRGIITIDQSGGNVTYNADYYGLGHFSRFLTPGSRRIESSVGSYSLQNAAFIRPDGTKVLVVQNFDNNANVINVQWGDRTFSYTMPADAAVTFTWRGHQQGGTTFDRTDWQASASSVSSDPNYTFFVPAAALDGSYGSAWTSGQAQAPGQWFQIDMGKMHHFGSITLDTAARSSDYPRGFEISVSTDGQQWSQPIASVSDNTSPVSTVTFARQHARYVRITLTASTGYWWSLCELNVRP